MSRKNIAPIATTFVVGVLTVVVVVGMSTGAPQERADGDQAVQTASTKPLLVEVAQPEQRALTRTLSMPATLLPGEMADLFAKVSGYIEKVNVDIGDRVQKGDALLTIDVPEMVDELRQAQAVLAARRAGVRALKAKVLQADSVITIARADVQRFEAELDLARITLDRKQTLLTGRAIPQQDFDEANSKLAISKAQSSIAVAKVLSAEAEKEAVEADAVVAQSEVKVEEAKLARLGTLMNYATITAPFDGVITQRLVDPGAFVRSAADGASTPLLTINNTSFIRLALDIPESDSAFVRPGTPVSIDVKAARGDPIEATVTRTAGALNPSTRTLRAEVHLPNEDGKFSPGMYAQVSIQLETKAQARLIPAKAIRVRGRDLSVLVVDGGIAKSVPIQIGYDDGIWVEVISGLSGSEQVIIAADSSVAPGVPVTASR